MMDDEVEEVLDGKSSERRERGSTRDEEVNCMRR